jgi:multidrug efflux pump subunit AcrA (membrane-fusion protein)
MRQQINLYQPIRSDARPPLSFPTLLAAVALLLVGLGAYTWHVHRQVGALERMVADLRAQYDEQQAQLEAAGQAQSARNEASAIERRVSELARTVRERRRALEILQSGAAGQTIGFAARMEALARRHVEGLWIDTLVLSGTNGSMTLGGGTLDPDIVPVYLRNLAQESALRGARFDDFVIERPRDTDKSTDESKVDSALPAHVRFRAGNKDHLVKNSALEAAT